MAWQSESVTDYLSVGQNLTDRESDRVDIICWESFDESKRMSAEATEDFQMLYEDLQIKYHTESLINYWLL